VTAAYVDSSFLLAIAFAEDDVARLRRVLARHDRLLSSDLIVAECLSAADREKLARSTMSAALQPIGLVLPSRPLAQEMTEALDEGQLRGADLWHVACALFVAGAERTALAFLSRDEPQRRVARRLGFPTP
jgi:predicted nucleic acid-binding protein